METVTIHNQTLPRGWNVQKLGNLSDVTTGSKDVNEGNPQGQYPFFTCSREVHASDNYSFDTEAILVAGNGVVGETKYYKGKFEAYQRTYVLNNFKINPLFLYFYLKGKLIKELYRHKSGSTMPYIKRGDLEGIEVPIPLKEEQQTIAAILSKIQEAIENQDKIIKTTTELKKSLMKKIFSEGLNGEPLKQTEIGKIPKSWEVRRISEVFKFTSKPRQLKENGKIPFIPMELIPIGELYVRDYISKDKVTSGTYIENGDLLIAKITPSFENGKQAIAQIDFNFAYATTEVIPVKGIEGVSSNKYLYYYLLIQNVRTVLAGKMEGSTGRQRLSKSILEETLIPMPKLDEQQRITDIFESLDKKIDFARRKKTIFTDLFKSMLNNLMSGKIRVNNITL